MFQINQFLTKIYFWCNNRPIKDKKLKLIIYPLLGLFFIKFNTIVHNFTNSRSYKNNIIML